MSVRYSITPRPKTHIYSTASIAYENILRFSRDCLRSTLAGHFQSRKIGGNAQLAACCSSFSSGSVCKTIAVARERKGVRGGCGRPASGGLSFSITKSVTTKHTMDVTSPHIARGCRTMFDRTDGRRDVRRAWWGGWRDGQTCVQARLPPVPARLSPTTLPPARRRLTGAGAQTDGWAGGRVRGGGRWSSAFDCARR